VREIKFTKSQDGVRRATLRVEHRLSVLEMAKVLANRIHRQGIDIDGYGWASSLDEIRGRYMVFTSVMPLIRKDLAMYGENVLFYDGCPEILRWAIKQVESATLEDNEEEI